MFSHGCTVHIYRLYYIAQYKNDVYSDGDFLETESKNYCDMSQ